MTVHRVAKGTMGIPMPALRKPPQGAGRRLQGGLAPEAYRSAAHKWGSGGRAAPEPFASTAIRLEVRTTQRWLHG